MERVLLVAGSKKAREQLIQLLKNSGVSMVTAAENGGEARRILIEQEFDLALINTPLLDEFGYELAIEAAEESNSGVIILVKNENADAIAAKVEDYGVIVVPKPLSRQIFYQSLKMVTAMRRRIVGLKKENLKLQNKVAEIKIVDRAKCVLIQYLNMTEPEAHRYIEKKSMDNRMTRKEIAENILRAYELD